MLTSFGAGSGAWLALLGLFAVYSGPRESLPALAESTTTAQAFLSTSLPGLREEAQTGPTSTSALRRGSRHREALVALAEQDGWGFEGALAGVALLPALIAEFLRRRKPRLEPLRPRVSRRDDIDGEGSRGPWQPTSRAFRR